MLKYNNSSKNRKKEVSSLGRGRKWCTNWIEAHRESEEKIFSEEEGSNFSLRQDSLYKRSSSNLWTMVTSDDLYPQRSPQRDRTVEGSSVFEGLHWLVVNVDGSGLPWERAAGLESSWRWAGWVQNPELLLAPCSRLPAGLRPAEITCVVKYQ